MEDWTETNLENMVNPMAMQLQDDLACNSEISNSYDTADNDGLESHLEKSIQSNHKKEKQIK